MIHSIIDYCEYILFFKWPTDWKAAGGGPLIDLLVGSSQGRLRHGPGGEARENVQWRPGARREAATGPVHLPGNHSIYIII